MGQYQPCTAGANSGLPEFICGFPEHDTPLCNLAEYDDNDKAEELPIITIKMNFHYIASSEGSFSPDTDISKINGQTLANSVINAANGYLEDIRENSLYESVGGVDFLGDSRIRFELHTEASNTEDIYNGIWYHDDNNPYMGAQYDNVVTVRFIDEAKYLLDEMDSLYLDPDDVCGYSGYGCTQPFGGGVVIRNAFLTRRNQAEGNGCSDAIWGSWEIGRVLIHEIGHGTGLCHTNSDDNECQEEDINPSWECSGPDTTTVWTGYCGASHEGLCDPMWSSNYMNNGRSSRQSLSKCQWKIMYRNLTEGSFEFSDICEVIDEPLIVSSNEVWEDLKMIKNKNVIIESGATLTINSCQVRMAQGGNFHVKRGGKLKIDNSTITNLCNAEKWGGIYVEGNQAKDQPELLASTVDFDDAGRLEIINSTLVHGSTVITNHRLNEEWNNDYRGGLIDCSNVSFIDNRRGAAFYKYDKVDNSRFEDCQFAQTGSSVFSGYGGVSIWRCNGIDFTGNVFSNLDYGILSYDAALNIRSLNNINNCLVGIDIYSTHPNSSYDEIGIPDLEPNIFESNHIHIQINGGNEGGETNITNNIFISCAASGAAVWVEGRHEASVDNNFFTDNIVAMVVRDTEYGISSFECNIVNDGAIGIIAQGKNDGFIFNANEFNSSVVDVSISNLGAGTNNGSIHWVQGELNTNNPTASKSASNLFSMSNSVDIATLGSDTETVSFTYLVPADATANGYEPDGNGNYSKILILREESDCEEVAYDPNFVGKPPYEIGDLIDIRLIKQSAEYAHNSNPEDANIKIDYERAKRAKEKVLSWLTANAVKAKNYDLAESYLIEETSKSSKKSLYGVKVLKADYASALAKLNELPEETIADIEYKLLQEINLAWLQTQLPPDSNFSGGEGEERDAIGVNEGEFDLSDEQYSLLTNVAHSNSTNRSTARSLLAVLRGERFVNTIDIDEIREAVALKYGNPEKEGSNIRVFPNPVRNQLSITGISYSDTDTSVELSDLTGKLVYFEKMSIGEIEKSIDLSNMSAGIYILSLRKGDQNIHYEKIVVAK